MVTQRNILALARLDLADLARSRWFAFAAALYAVLVGLFVLVGLRESNILGFTGMGRVLLSVCHALVLLLPLLALTACGQVVNRAREDGSLELLFSHPVSRAEYFLSLTLVRYAALLLPLVVLLFAASGTAWALFRMPVPWAFLGRTAAISAGLLWAFVGLGLAVSTTVRNPAKAMMVLVMVWVASVALLDFGLIGLMLRWRLNAMTVFFIAGLNPVESARLALLSSAEPSLATLGPVGFYLANRLGAGWLFASGVLWPLAIGTLAWVLALRRFSRGDLV